MLHLSPLLAEDVCERPLLFFVIISNVNADGMTAWGLEGLVALATQVVLLMLRVHAVAQLTHWGGVHHIVVVRLSQGLVGLLLLRVIEDRRGSLAKCGPRVFIAGRVCGFWLQVGRLCGKRAALLER